MIALETADGKTDVILFTGDDDGAWGEISGEDAALHEHAWEDLRRFDTLVTEQAEEIVAAETPNQN